MTDRQTTLVVVCLLAFMHIYIERHSCMSVYIYTYIFTWKHVCIHLYLPGYVHMHSCISAYIKMYHIYNIKYAFMHTCMDT